MDKLILLAHFPKISPKRYQQLLAAFSNIDNAWEAEFDELTKIGWDVNLVHEFLTWKEKINEEVMSAVLEKENIICITIDDVDYPSLLKQIYDPPFCLFVKGKLTNSEFNLAVVGTRKCTPYGRQVTEELVSDLAAKGITIVSGLAFGIDSIAHGTAIKARGTTIAVLGSGNNTHNIYPTAHRDLAQNIIEHNGAIITEYPPGTEPTAFSFPRRNRIIAGMSLGTLVIEAGEQSGALITSSCALENGREVFAVPQNITSHTSIGPNNLLKMGAHLVTKADDILDALDLHNVSQYVTNKDILPDSPTEAELLKYLSREPIHVDMITKQTGLTSSTVNSTLTLMEMKGKVRNLGGMMYVTAR